MSNPVRLFAALSAADTVVCDYFDVEVILADEERLLKVPLGRDARPAVRVRDQDIELVNGACSICDIDGNDHELELKMHRPMLHVDVLPKLKQQDVTLRVTFDPAVLVGGRPIKPIKYPADWDWRGLLVLRAEENVEVVWAGPVEGAK